jgi:CRP-like cAMP-binding protein
VKLTPEEEHIRRLVFADLPPRKVLQILSIGAWTTVDIGERLLEHGKSIDAISVIVRGRVRIKKDDRVLGELAAGDIVGSALLLSGATADVDAEVVEPIRSMRWEVAPLERYLAANPETRIVLQKHLARDLATKVIAATKL